MKPGFKTTEFWLSFLAMGIGFLMTSGLVTAGTSFDKAIGLIAAALAAMGYSASRATVKASEASAALPSPDSPK